MQSTKDPLKNYVCALLNTMPADSRLTHGHVTMSIAWINKDKLKTQNKTEAVKAAVTLLHNMT